MTADVFLHLHLHNPFAYTIGVVFYSISLLRYPYFSSLSFPSRERKLRICIRGVCQDYGMLSERNGLRLRTHESLHGVAKATIYLHSMYSTSYIP